MGKHRKRMPLCAYCGGRIKSRWCEWHYYATALERATLMAVHRDKDPVARASRWSSRPDGGHVTALKGRGWWGLNAFCGNPCAMRWLKANTPEPKWEAWPPPPQGETE